MTTQRLSIILLFITFSVRAETVRISLGVFDSAGDPSGPLPSLGTLLHCESPDEPFLSPAGQEVGYLPAVHREAIRIMQSKGVHLEFEVRHHYAVGKPGRFLQIEVWAETDRPGHLVPLFYSLPVHPENVLADW
jgi:hypothetical protein